MPVAAAYSVFISGGLHSPSSEWYQGAIVFIFVSSFFLGGGYVPCMGIAYSVEATKFRANL